MPQASSHFPEAGKPENPPNLSGRRGEDRPAANPRPVDPGLALALALCGVYFLWALWGSGSERSRMLVSDFAQLAAPTIGLFWAAGRYRKTRNATHGPGRGSAGFFTCGILCWALGQVCWIVEELVLNIHPFPSLADLGFLAASGCSILGILLMPGNRRPAWVRVRALLDSLLIMTGIFAFGWFFLVGPILLKGQGMTFAKILAASYPTMGFVIVFCAILTAQRSAGSQSARIRNLIGVAALASVSSDLSFAYLNLKGTYLSGHPLDVGWMAGTMILGRAVHGLWKLAPEEEASETRRTMPTVGQVLLPYALVPAVGTLVFFTWQSKEALGLSTGVYLASGLLVVLLLVRQLLSLTETSRLYRDLHTAYTDMEALAAFDGMTGLSNHRTFQERLREEIARCETEGAPLSLLLVDVDHFKGYNDTFGHPAGDEALKVVAGLLRKTLRTSDLPARYGGEEFAAILPRTGLDGALVVAERLRQKCEATEFPYRSVTLSVGVATLDARSVVELIEAADRALYSAKRRGRNRVEIEREVDFLRVVTGSGPEDSKEVA